MVRLQSFGTRNAAFRMVILENSLLSRQSSMKQFSGKLQLHTSIISLQAIAILLAPELLHLDW
jgi:hypothetical protein